MFDISFLSPIYYILVTLCILIITTNEIPDWFDKIDKSCLRDGLINMRLEMTKND